MPTRHVKSGVTVTYPSAYRHVAGDRTRTRGAGDGATREDELIALLQEQELTVVDTFELEATEAAGTRASAEAAGPIQVDVDLEAGEQGVLLVEQDGVYTWVFPDELDVPAASRTARDGAAGKRQITFTLPTDGAAAPEGTRGLKSWLGKLVAEKIRGIILKFAAGFVTDKVLTFLERNVQRGIVLMRGTDPQTWTLTPDLSALSLPDDRAPRILLFVHGTFSSTLGSYGALGATPWGRSFLENALQSYDAVIGFDHPTLSEDPLENAIELLRLLRSAPWKKAPVFDGVGYSRGGLVLRSLIEHVLPNAGWDARFDRAVFVGATNAGTRLAEPDHWRDFIDLYTNLAVAASKVLALVPGATAVPGILGGIVKSVGAFAKYLATHAVSEGHIPGLAAMEPDGAFVREINKTQPNQPSPDDIDYYAVISSFESRLLSNGQSNGLPRATQLPKRLVMLLADRLVDQLMDADNDLVVHTRSMTSIDEQVKGFVKEVCDFGPNPVVYHTVYFAQVESVNALRHWLKVPGEAPEAPVRRRNGDGQAYFALDVQYRPPAESTPAVRAAHGEKLPLKVEVWWGDITLAPGDVYAVGHYLGVLPQYAELALDRAVSDAPEEGDLVLTSLTRRNMLHGDLGEVAFFPWGGSNKRNRFVAVCGMGHPGFFDEEKLRMLHRNLAWTLNTFPDDRTLCTVLIGSGEGTLTIEASVRGMIQGFGDALRAARGPVRIQRVRVVERQKNKAERIHRALQALQNDAVLDLQLDGKVRTGEGGRISDEHRIALLVGAAARASTESAASPRRKALDHLVKLTGDAPEAVTRTLRSLHEQGDGDVDAIAQRLEVTVRQDDDERAGSADRVATRISFMRSDDVYRAAAITDTATVPERLIEVDPRLIEEVVRRMTDPPADDLDSLSDFLMRLVIPRDFRDLLLGSGGLVFELNRHAAVVHWEMLAMRMDDTRCPLGLARPVARQLRTTYSPPPFIHQQKTTRRALVIGDPDGSLPGARREAFAVADLLAGKDIEVTLLVGSAAAPSDGTPPATRIDVLRRLMDGSFDLVHYAGHGSFDFDAPNKTGWLFSDGLLTAREVGRVDRVPALIVANACLSGRTSEVGRNGSELPYGEAGLLPSLADEFFHRGVRNYVGTAWEVDDRGAVDFAKTFYDTFFADRPSQRGRCTLGEALLDARQKLAEKASYGALWAAYQHYGDPSFRETEL